MKSLTFRKSKPLFLLTVTFALFHIFLARESSAGVDFNLADAPVRVNWSENLINFGKVLAPLGDINGDGIPDFAIRAEFPEGGSVMAIYFGKRDSVSWMSSLTLDNADVVIRAENRLDMGIVAGDFGEIISAGDIDGDGISDFAVTAPLYQSGGLVRGKVYVFYGKTTWHSGPAEVLADATYTGPGESIAGSYTFMSVSIGNFNGDRYKDLLIWQEYNNGSFENISRMYLFLGRPERFASPIFSSDAHSVWSLPAGFSIKNPAFVGDMNHDGFEEIAVVSSPYFPSSGSRAIVNIFAGNSLGSFGSPVQLSAHSYSAGRPVKVGDINGDGYDDFIIEDIGFGIETNIHYDLIQGTSDLSGIRINTSFYGTGLLSLSGYGDVNGDGISDLLFSGRTIENRAMLLLGRRSGWGASVDCSTRYDVRFVGEDGPAGEGIQFYDSSTVSIIGDTDGDSRSDILIRYLNEVTDVTDGMFRYQAPRGRVYLMFSDTLFPNSSFLIFPWIIYQRPLIFPDDIDPRPWPQKLYLDTNVQVNPVSDVLKKDDTKQDLKQ